MTGSTGSSRRPTGRLFVLLMLAVLTGLLGMHALGPGGAPAGRSDATHEMAMAQVADAPHLSSGCSHTDGGNDHLDHADGTCAAAGIGSAYAPPALTSALMDTPAACTPVAGTARPAEGCRAPPDLSELQLLRI
ncbi:DUF6153 family protein [Streptomyces goshikiensis]|uniref:DUF6153 family protein n=1 Tax=Streptomyces goshikiensis TaxID=1942 RepID=A0ABZ1RQT0_9ACTN|nr:MULTISPECIES: DUF6153 family protein [Streptomyces]ALO08164.1 hypothetical protein AQF52_2569 [Streptomyces venezuelae]QPK45422.1 hypothetical protein H4W23_12770 [Streptomyces gardneri]WRK36747.1 DUF6153 family protein [Streptomyces venezuelae]CUM41480.1 putative membrane protein [Streptomyces venezuelae]